MNCLAFERLLDEGEPGALGPAALAHARECAGCARSLARARSLESALELRFSARAGPGDELPADFTDRVMLRVERVEARLVRWLALPDELPWWVRAAAEPGVALASTVAALLLWRGESLLALARAWAPAAMSAPARLAEVANAAGFAAIERALAHAFVPGPGADWSVVTAMGLGLAPLVALAAYALWRISERLTDPVGASAVS